MNRGLAGVSFYDSGSTPALRQINANLTCRGEPVCTPTSV